jgi:hypothetical protein
VWGWIRGVALNRCGREIIRAERTERRKPKRDIQSLPCDVLSIRCFPEFIISV